MSLRTWQRRLPEGAFVRIHRDTLVNLAFVEEARRENGSWWVKMEGAEDALAMSRRAALALKRWKG